MAERWSREEEFGLLYYVREEEGGGGCSVIWKSYSDKKEKRKENMGEEDAHESRIFLME